MFLVAVAHELAAHPSGWSSCTADLLRQLYITLDAALRQPREARRTAYALASSSTASGSSASSVRAISRI